MRIRHSPRLACDEAPAAVRSASRSRIRASGRTRARRRPAGAGRRHRLLPARARGSPSPTSAWRAFRRGTAGRRRCSTCPATTSTTTTISTTTHARLRALCEALDILWLERETAGDRRRPLRRHHALDRFRRAGRARPTTMAERAQEARQGHARGQLLPARRPATTRAGEPFLAEAVARALTHVPGAGCAQALAAAVRRHRPWSSRTSRRRWRSADPRYGLTPGTAGFCNSLDELLPRAAALAARPPALRRSTT